jgi:tRNA-specific 2-thiouridylase
MLEPHELERVIFPLGESLKQEVRDEARARSLHGADKGESQELCFVPNGDYAAFVEERAPERIRPGPIVDIDGRPLGGHAGVHRFTIGQRRGLGVALGKAAYVARLEDGAVVVGDEHRIACGGALLAEDDWSEDVRFPLRADVKVRSHHRAARARIERLEGSTRIAFEEPVRALAPGQIAVAYQGDRVLGGGTIVESLAP